MPWPTNIFHDVESGPLCLGSKPRGKSTANLFGDWTGQNMSGPYPHSNIKLLESPNQRFTPSAICTPFLFEDLVQGRRKHIKVGWDNFEIHSIAAEKSDKLQILPGKTICSTKSK